MNEQINQSYSSIYSNENLNQNKYYEFITTFQLSSKNNNERKNINNNIFDISNWSLNDEIIKIENVYYFINNFLIRKNYKSVIKFIDNKFNIFENKFKDSLITIFNIKLNCYFKIINNKLNQYKIQNMNILYNKNSKLSISLEKLFKRVKIEIKSFINKLKEIYNNNNYLISFCNKEKLIQIYIENLFLLSRFSLIKHFINDSISYCSMAYNLIKDHIKKCKDPNVYNSYSKILLLMSTLLIKNGCYSNALNFLKINFRLIKKEILIKCFNNEENNVKINIKNLSFNIKEKFNKSLLNLVLNFYLTGICYENLNINTYSVQSYKSANFFCSNFFKENNRKFFEIIFETNILFMKKYSHFNIHRKFEREKTKKFFEEKLLNKNKNDNNQKLFKNNSMIINKSEKFKKLTYFIENQIKLNKHEIPYTINTIENKDNSDLDILESLKFIDDLLSENYKEYVYKNKNFNYNKPKRETIFFLEKYNQKLFNKKLNKNNSQQYFIKLNNKNNIDNNNFHSNISSFSVKNSVLLKQNKNNLENYFYANKNNNNFFNNSRTSKNLSFINKFKTFKESSSKLKLNNIIKNNNKDSILNNKKCFLKNKSHSSKNFKNKNKNKKLSAFEIQKKYCKNLSHRNLNNFSHNLSEYKKIKKYPVNIYYNNKSYKKKRNFLEKLEKREINFQKNLLSIKKYDANVIINSNEILDKYQIIKDANCTFLRIKENINSENLSKLLFFLNNKEKNETNSYKNLIDKINNEKDKIKDSIVTGLNTKKINKIKELEKNIIEVKNEHKNKLNNNNHNNKTIDSKNELIQRKLSQNYNDINNSCLSNLSKELQQFKIKKSNINKLIKENIINI